jgi:hypothetical protein
MTFSPEQQEERRKYLNASEVRPLMTSDPEGLMYLWRIKTGREAPENLDWVWPVGVGQRTEDYQLDWREQHGGICISRRQQRVFHSLHPQFAATLDGWHDMVDCHVEVKHVNGREPVEVVIDRYMPQLHFQMMCCNTRQCALGIAKCLEDPLPFEFIELDDGYGSELLTRALRFWEHVKRDTPPVALPPVPPPVSKWHDYDMRGNDSWRRNAETWLQTRGAVEACKDAEKTLKSLVPEDARKCFGNGVRITRGPAGRLSLRIDA